jgi:hypothetical protein
MHDLSHCFEAPTVLLDRCDTFVADLEEPGVCTSCGWLVDEHPDTALTTRVAA